MEENEIQELHQDRIANLLELLKSNLWIIMGSIGVIALLLTLVPLFSAIPLGMSDGTLIPLGEDEIGFCFWDLLGKTVFSWGFFFALLFILAATVCGFLFRFHLNFAVASTLLYLIGACLLVCTPSFYELALSFKLGADVGDIASLSECAAGAGVIVPVILCFIAAMLGVSQSNVKNPFSLVEIAEMGILIALAVICDLYLSFDISAGPGSINLAMVPLFLIALRHGPAKGFVAGGIVFGFITCLTDGDGIYTFPFDYLVGFGSICMLGFFRKWIFTEKEPGFAPIGFLYILIGGILATLVRFIGSTASSMVIYGYEIIPAMEYNVLYILPTGAIATGVMMALYVPLARVNSYTRRHNAH